MAKGNNRSMAPLSDIVVVPGFNGRRTFTGIEELAVSIDRNGLINALGVREGGPSKLDGRRSLFLVTGERRYRALLLLRDPDFKPVDAKGEPIKRRTTPASWVQVPVKLEKGDAAQFDVRNYIENADREDVPPLEEAEHIDGIMKKHGWSQAEFCARTGKNKAHVSQRLSLLKSAPVREAVQSNVLTATQAREVVTLPEEQQKAVVAEVKDRQKSGKQMSVQDVKQIADKEKSKLGIKHNKDRKVDKDGAEYDKDKIGKAREMYDGKSLDMRPKTAVIEQLGGLMQRLERPNISDSTKEATKLQINTLEWLFGLREKL